MIWSPPLIRVTPVVMTRSPIEGRCSRRSCCRRRRPLTGRRCADSISHRLLRSPAAKRGALRVAYYADKAADGAAGGGSIRASEAIILTSSRLSD
jgi:hypothetical protein